MANNEHYSPDPFSGLPKVTPGAIEAYKNRQPRDFDADLETLKANNPAVAEEFLKAVNDIDPRLRLLQRSFAQGALFLYSLLDGVAQAEQLEHLVDSEAPSSETLLAGLPKVPQAAIDTYKRSPRAFDDDFEKLKRSNPIIAHELITGIHGVDPHFLELKRAFARGALFMYGVLDGASETRQLEELFTREQEPPSDGGDDEDQPLLA